MKLKADEMKLKAGDLLHNGRYHILGVLSDKGGMGMIYQARDLTFSTTVVIKQLLFTDVESLRREKTYSKLPDAELHEVVAEMKRAFEREAKLLFGLDHKALPRVFDRFQTAVGAECLVMDFIAGQDFDELLAAQRGPFPLAQVLDWADQILDALVYLHTQSIIHRDINPRNLKLTPKGQVILLDFGLAKGSLPGMTVVRSVLGGSDDYAPIEQLDPQENERQKSDPRSDLYSLAVTLYHLLSGRKPASAVSRVSARARPAADPLRPLDEIAAHIPAAVAAVLQHAAGVYADERPASAAALRQLLREAVTPTPPRPAPLPKPEEKTVVRPKPSAPETKRRIEVSLDSASPPPAPPPIVRPKPAAPQSYSEDLGGGVRLEMIAIPGGSFLMGSPDGEGYDWEHPQHRVTVAPFYLGKYQVTQAQWKAVMGVKKKWFGLADNNPSTFKGDDLPVESVSWEDAVKFCAAISQRTGKSYRLPSETEWEYACRAGSDGQYCFGDDEALLGEYAWYVGNAGRQTHPVGRKKPNAWGLYDMHGNVWEWCEDDWHSNYESAPRDGHAWVSAPRHGSARVNRGGGWYDFAVSCRSANRNNDAPGYRNDGVGFRLVRT